MTLRAYKIPLLPAAIQLLRPQTRSVPPAYTWMSSGAKTIVVFNHPAPPTKKEVPDVRSVPVGQRIMSSFGAFVMSSLPSPVRYSTSSMRTPNLPGM